MKDEDSPSRQKQNPSFIKKNWVVISGIAAASFALLLNAPTLIVNLENLPADVSRLATKYLSWYHEDVAWTGFWSTAYPEGYVDFEEMDLSDV
ncbi:hypothetical protein SAMN05216315_10750 [Nitrosospira sp. Nsp18]|uniref:hypothetical protein n=1 Tax=Nitrosospira sp. Nsp18 TaxID=1855334 RepID=UPI00088FBB85|nr:hypothetical protein [Nitrosospira sp. Nsp18]SDA16216.1 hypothetical protein SAMN05216315_10750 [Nitrosospira sp. Nsp18]